MQKTRKLSVDPSTLGAHGEIATVPRETSRLEKKQHLPRHTKGESSVGHPDLSGAWMRAVAQQRARVATTLVLEARPLISRDEFEREWVAETALLPGWSEINLLDHSESVEMDRLIAGEDWDIGVNASGRRSGKTERAIRWALKDIARKSRVGPVEAGKSALCVFAAPTRDQAKKLFRDKVLSMLPRRYWFAEFRESDLSLKLWNNCEIVIAGMNRAERIEGCPIFRLVLDELAECKPLTFSKNLQPSLSTAGRERGRAMLIGVPRGARHFKEIYDLGQQRVDGVWSVSWPSSRVLDEKTLARFRRTTDPITFEQEYNASWETSQGRVYYPFRRGIHMRESLLALYEPTSTLVVAFDFNVEPGTATVMQEVWFRNGYRRREDRPEVADAIVAVLGLVYIPISSNTELVCRKFVEDWGGHRGEVVAYGDPSGGNRHSSQRMHNGSDWDTINEIVGGKFRGRYSRDVPAAHPPVKSRVNTLNSLLMNADGVVTMLVDRDLDLVGKDFEDTKWIAGGPQEIDKKTDKKSTHITDEVGYYAERRFGEANQVYMDN